MKKTSREKALSYMPNEKTIIVLLIVGLMKKAWLYKIKYFPEPHTHGKNVTEFLLDLSNYATKSNLKRSRYWYW